ncbi:MAG: GNAT family N-acetyltransferase [Emcibacteraceae bacterium]|nr:GNAT family N-acetyltransferase [Emcibacteraceae bacterium]MDG1858344.1 GNAT family N-acetyltransferase [Emcibacteraceae bacterium]
MNIREATEGDRGFILSLAPTLIENAKLDWHSDKVLNSFQDRYIEESIDQTERPQILYIAEDDGLSLGFIHVVEITEEISQAICANISLLAVTKEAQGKGVGRTLMEQAEKWAKEKGYPILQLEVFYNNHQARGFYEAHGFMNDTIVMAKPLKS